MYMDINKTIISCITEITSLETSDINTEDTLLSLGIDSLMTVELVISIEDNLQITFEDSDLDSENFKTVQSVIDIVRKYTER